MKDLLIRLYCRVLGHKPNTDEPWFRRMCWRCSEELDPIMPDGVKPWWEVGGPGFFGKDVE